MRGPLCLQKKKDSTAPNFFFALLLNPDDVNVLSILFFFFFLSSNLHFALEEGETSPLLWAFFFSSVCDFHSQKGTDSARTWPAERHSSPVYPCVVTQHIIQTCWSSTVASSRLKHQACSWLGSVTSIQPQQGLKPVCCAPPLI